MGVTRTPYDVDQLAAPNVPNPRHGQALSTQAPRFVRFSVNYDY